MIIIIPIITVTIIILLLQNNHLDHCRCANRDSSYIEINDKKI